MPKVLTKKEHTELQENLEFLSEEVYAAIEKLYRVSQSIEENKKLFQFLSIDAINVQGAIRLLTPLEKEVNKSLSIYKQNLQHLIKGI